jgi:hypothetical protein
MQSPADETLGSDSSTNAQSSAVAEGICGWCACDRLRVTEARLRDLGENIAFSVTRYGKTIKHHVPGGLPQPGRDRRENP